MTEEPTESYDSGEVVWVKLGSSWWPGEVKNADELPSEVLDFKKPPLAIVKFFDEDSYEYVKTWTNIYPYNSEKKNEFIKKGMAAYRAKVPHMEKFPKDVLKAEEKVGGNPNILSNPMFLPEKKRNYAAEIFGTPSPKTSTPKNKKRSNANKSSKKDMSHITHRRFLGVDDYRAYICIQYPGKDRIPGDKEDEEVIRINRELEQDFNCHSCSFSTKRLEVMILHTKSHIQGVYLASARKNKQTVRRRKEKLKKVKGSDVVDSDTTTSDSEPIRQRKRKPKAQGAKKTKIKKTEEEEVAPKKDIRSELLEAWEDSEDEDMDFTFDQTKESEVPEKSIDSSSVPELPKDDSKKSDVLDRSEGPKQSDSTVTEIVDDIVSKPVEELKSQSQTIEEVLNDVSGEPGELTVSVEPVKPVEEQLSTEKLLSTLEDDLTDVEDKPVEDKPVEDKPVEDKPVEDKPVEDKPVEDKLVEDKPVEDKPVEDKLVEDKPVKKKPVKEKPVMDKPIVDKPVDKKNEEVTDDVKEKPGDNATPVDTEEDVSKQKMDQDIHEAIKSCFDFDEDEEDDAIVGKAATGRKIPRVIPKVSRKTSTETEPATDKAEDEDMSAAFKELMEITSVPDLPEVQNSLKCEQNFHNIKTIKFPDKPERAGSPPPKPERKDSTEIATKLTNPKKRFVKSFEDFELMQNEIRRKEEETSKTDGYEDEVRTEAGGPSSTYDYLDDSNEQDSPDSNIQLSKLKSKIMSKIIEEAKINTESKNRIMSKMSKPVATEAKSSIVEPLTRTTVAESAAKLATVKPVAKLPGVEPVSRWTTVEPVSKWTTIEPVSKLPTVEPVAKSSTVEPVTKLTTVEPVVKLPTVKPATVDPVTKSTIVDSVAKPPAVEPEAKPSTNRLFRSKTQKAVGSHRTPRSKILESYRKDADKHKVEEKSQPKGLEVEHLRNMLVDVRLNVEVMPPKKSKWSRRGSHPKKDRNLFLSPDVEPASTETVKPTVEEPVHSENQTYGEMELINDTGKIGEITLKEAKSPSPVEVPVQDVVEEEVETTVKEPEPAEPQLTELTPVQMDESYTTLDKEEVVEESQLLIDEEIEVADIPLPPEIKETPLETADIPLPPETSQAKASLMETKEIPHEEVIESAPEEIVEKPPQEIVEDPPLETVEVPPQETIEVPPQEIVEVPLQEIDEVPPQEIVEVPPQEVIEEAKLEEIPQKMEEETPEKSIEDENKIVLEQVADVSPQEPSPIVEESPVKDGLSSETAEDTFIVPSNETETAVSNKIDTEPIPITEEHIEVDDSLPMSLTVETDTELPHDAILTPPKKSKKRKMSEDDKVEPQPEDFTPLEKRIKEGENVEEDTTIAPTEAESELKVASEVTLESEPVEDEPQTVKNDKEEITDAEQTVEVTDEMKKAEESVESEKKEETKSDGELVVDVLEAPAVSEEKEEGPETDLKKPDEETPETDSKKPDKEKPETDSKKPEEEKPETDSKKPDEDKPETVPKKVAEEKSETDSMKPDEEKPETVPKKVAEEKPESVEVDNEPDHNNEVEIQCASSSVDSFRFSIQTNLSILSSREEMSALALATLSEIKADLESNEDVMATEEEEEPKRERVLMPPVLPESEMVPIEGNLTVVSEKDLADGQVEITSEQVISPKRPVTLSNFSMDFSDSFSDSNSNSMTDASSDVGKLDFNSKGTEFTAKALTKQMKKVDQKKESRYGRLELINILEGNSEMERRPKEFVHPPKKPSVVDDICDFEEHIPSQIVCAKNLKKDVTANIEQDFKEFKEKEKTSKTSVKSTTSKLLERLTTESKAKASAAKAMITPDPPVPELATKLPPRTQAVTPKTTKYLSRSRSGLGFNKPIILSEQIVKAAIEPPKSKLRKSMEDFEDVEAFVIHKDPVKANFQEEETKKTTSKTPGKAKILQQTIITPAGEIIQPTVAEVQPDDNIFDINSMPIVLSDEILTPESIEKMPIVIGSDAKVTVPEKPVKKPAPSRVVTTVATQVTPNKTVTITKHKPPRILQSFSNKTAKNSPLLPNTAKPGKYIIVPQSSIPPTKYLSKKPTIVKKPAAPAGVVQKVPSIAPEPSGNKIMIVTNQQGQQQRLLLTPAQQKMLGYQNQKVTKTIVKGNVMQKSVLASKGVALGDAGTSGVVSKTTGMMGQKVMVGNAAAHGLITTTSHQIASIQGRTTKTVTKRTPTGSQKLGVPAPKPQKTILIKNQHGQTVRKIQGNDDELLDKQVAEQLKAIKASSGMKFGSQQKPLDSDRVTPKGSSRRSYSKRVEVKPRGPPPLSSIPHTARQETVVSATAKKAEHAEAKPSSEAQQTERPLNQLVIQDAVGNQTTITEGQILALPSETLDGQPQSYMLVTLDESGNLTPLNNEALMSLDPNLGLGGDLSNMVLQFDQSGVTDQPQAVVVKPPEVAEPAKAVEVETTPQPVPVPEPAVTTEISETVAEQKLVPSAEAVPQVTTSTNGDSGQQLIVTGDPIATQKFLESLTEGTTDLANILANAEGNSILIQADGQQILINTNTDNQMLLSMNDGATVTEGGGNPIFATQPSKNTDILAAALADTDVFQQEHPSGAPSKIGSQLSPSNALYPMNVGNVLETSLTLNSPIMTPLEVPSNNTKKIPDDEADILTQVPKNVDLPITITDPNISQTVANQQVSQMIANELQTNLELALPISETTISTASTEMNSPSYVYSLPSLDDSVEMAQKPFNGSMPLLTEDVVEEKKSEEEGKEPPKEKEKAEMGSGGFLAVEEGRFTLGGEMCSSLSEPPPEMFDLPEVTQAFAEKAASNVPSLQSTPDVSDNASKDGDTTDLSQADTSSEGSCEIPLQPQIVTKSLDLSRNLDSLKRSLGEAEGESKRCKFD